MFKLNKSIDVNMFSKGQGTIEYLVILGVIILIGLVVVGLSTNFLEQTEQINTSTSRIDSSIGITGISITENVLDLDGNGAITITNTDTQPITLTKIVVDGVDNNYNKFLFSGDSATVLLNNLSCTCLAGETSKTCTYTFYFTQNEVTTTKTQILTANCSSSFSTEDTSTTTPTISDSTAPTITLSTPLTGYKQKSVSPSEFVFNVTDDSTITSCTLTIDSTDVNSITAPSGDTSIKYAFAEDINYGWSITCVDSFSNSATSGSRIISIDNNNYEINDCNQLYLMRNNLSGNYLLKENIDCENFDPDGAATTFSPIGDNSTPFTGNLNGNDYNISNLEIDDSATSFIALFGETSSSTINNVGIKNGTIIGNYYVGGIVGRTNNSTTIQNSFFSGTITSTGTAGGIVGQNYGSSTITNSYSTGTILGGNNIGGIIGDNYTNGTITNSYFSGTITSTGNEVGGVAGQNSTGTIINCYNTGNITGIDKTGGVVGDNYYGTITTSYNFGNIDGRNYIGGITGTNSSGTIRNSYSTGTVNGNDRVGGMIGNTGGNLGLSTTGIIENSYSTGNVTAAIATYAGAGIGRSNFRSIMINLFATGEMLNEGSGFIGTNESNGDMNNVWHYNSENTCFGTNNGNDNGCLKANAKSDFYTITQNVFDTNEPQWSFGIDSNWNNICNGTGYPPLIIESINDSSDCVS